MIRILIAEEQRPVRECLNTMLNMEYDMQVQGLVTDGVMAYELTARLQPDLLIMNIHLPVMHGITVLKQLKQTSPRTKVLLLTTDGEDPFIVEGLVNGASGYLLKSMLAKKIIPSVRDIVSGQYIMPTIVAAKLAQRLTHLPMEQHAVTKVDMPGVELSEREKQVAELIAQGSNNREIAAALFISEGTVRNYLSVIYSKLCVTNRFQAFVKLHSLL
ncbi:response regulator transcription factor [Paenibacillus sp. JCM 10914]|uniref:response regulator transcription factor n=1 Tax=Paenibacillus sp. JCM 10914 TaxID=1236974 RepID=UPI0003CC5E50|nr:response regulator transcription factor [Paenibacillus sp. JCM 10914]GAE07860.1 two-component response regulator [Paenibacillus sp. JCM 10914]